MKKRTATIVTLVFLVLLAIFYISLIPKQLPQLAPVALFTPPSPGNCNQENITNIWNSVFQTPIQTILNETQSGDCSYFVYQTDTNVFYILAGSKDGGIHIASGIYLQPNSENIQALTANLSGAATVDEAANRLNNFLSKINRTELRQITLDNVNSHYTSIFPDEPTSWELDEENEVFLSESTDDNETLTATIERVVSKNFTYTYVVYTTCFQSWVAHNTTCSSNQIITYYTDANNCGTAAGMPANQTFTCSQTQNNIKIIGDEDDIIDTRLEIDVFIDNTPLNLSANYTQTKNIKLKDDNKTIVEFTHDFSASPLNLTAIEIEKQSSSSSLGYLLVRGLEVTKKVTVDKKSTNSSKVCVKDSASVDEIDDITDDCSASNEDLINCPGLASGYNCTISNSMFIVSGLAHSAVIEFPSSLACTTNWTCTNWTSCANSQQARLCTDRNNCGTSAGKPSEIQTCATACTPNWNCTDWLPEKCPKNETLNRECTDLNNCNVVCLSGNANCREQQACEYKSSTSLILIIILVVVILLAISIIAVVLIRKKHPQDFNQTQNQMNPTALFERKAGF